MNKDSKDISFYAERSINCNGKSLDLLTPVVMGIVNVSPDSFYIPKVADTIKPEASSTENILEQVCSMIDCGARIIDVGAYSSRPGAKHIVVEEELKRLLPAVKAIRDSFPDVIISVDTFRAEVALKVQKEGADVINDISGGGLDNEMFDVIASSQMGYILMHMQGTPQNMQDDPKYKDVFKEVYTYFEQRVQTLKQMGVENIILDPGFGFGKTVEHNYMLLNRLSGFHELGCPVLAGISRKSMINKVLNTTPEKALNGTSVLNTIALLNGASILRVHDVKEAMEVIKLVKYSRSEALATKELQNQ